MDQQKRVLGTQANQQGEGVREDFLEGGVACALMVQDVPMGLHSPFLPAGCPGAAVGILFWRSESGKPPGPQA